jgi:uncharacterized membrane protein
MNQQLDNLRRDIERLEEQIGQQQRQLQQMRASLDELTPQPGAPAPIPVLSAAPVKEGLENFVGLKLIQVAGIIVLVAGLAIGVKYAIDKEMISETARIVLAYLAGGILFFLSHRLRRSYTTLSAILFSGSMASGYFTTYAAFGYYQLLTAPVAFGIMVLITAFTTYQAIRYEKQQIAILGMIGAYGIPFFISTHNEQIELLFTYMLLINSGILYLAFRRLWRVMTMLALCCSWIMVLLATLATDFSFFQQGHFLFLAGFYVLFLLAGLAGKITGEKKLSRHSQSVLLINNIALLLAMLVDTNEKNAALIIGSMTLFLTGQAVLARYLAGERMLSHVLYMQAIVLAVLFVWLQWNGMTVTLAWVAMAGGLFTAGFFLQLAWPRRAALLLMAATLLKLVALDSLRFSAAEKVICYLLVGTFLLVLSFLYQQYGGRFFGGSQ